MLWETPFDPGVQLAVAFVGETAVTFRLEGAVVLQVGHLLQKDVVHQYFGTPLAV